MLAVNKHILASKLLLAKDKVITHVSNYYSSITDLMSLNVKSAEEHLLCFAALFSIITIEL